MATGREEVRLSLIHISRMNDMEKNQVSESEDFAAMLEETMVKFRPGQVVKGCLLYTSRHENFAQDGQARAKLRRRTRGFAQHPTRNLRFLDFPLL